MKPLPTEPMNLPRLRDRLLAVEGENIALALNKTEVLALKTVLEVLEPWGEPEIGRTCADLHTMLDDIARQLEGM